LWAKTRKNAENTEKRGKTRKKTRKNAENTEKRGKNAEKRGNDEKVLDQAII